VPADAPGVRVMTNEALCVSGVEKVTTDQIIKRHPFIDAFSAATSLLLGGGGLIRNLVVGLIGAFVGGALVRFGLLKLPEAVRERFTDCVDVQVLRPESPGAATTDGSGGATGAGADGHRGEPSALFRQYLAATRGEVDEALAGLFAELVEECAP